MLMLKRSLLLIGLLELILSLAGCQQVSDARSEFCTNLRDVGAMRTQYIAALKAADKHAYGQLLAFARS